jgi:hypothetical protein
MIPRRIRLTIGEVRVSGLSPLDARRFVDKLEGELRVCLARASARGISTALQSRAVPTESARTHAHAHIERSAAPLARALVGRMLT